MMNNDPLERMPLFDRVSIRAVLATDGQHPQAALSKAGIIDPVAIPVVLGEEMDLSGGILGDGITPNLTAVLETEQQEGDTCSQLLDGQPCAIRAQPERAQPVRKATATLPAAFGLQPLAPVRPQGG